MSMRLERITDAGHDMYKTALELYRSSFPLHEQREAASQANILRDPDYCFYLIYDNAVFAGLLLCWETAHFIYLEHFCIIPELRGRRYGQRALDLLQQRKKSIILEIDPPIDDISMRRKGFYQRNGFAANPYSHIHPPYHRENAGHALEVMTSPLPITPEEYHRFNRYLQRHVMAEVFD